MRDNSSADDPVEYPVDGTLDLHLFPPAEVREVVREYIGACLERGITRLRIVHGKGKGVQRRIVHSLLAEHPDVLDYRHEGGSGGGWGATVVDLRPAPPP
jgi:DNA-nicking Smr family endonuclease